MTGKNKLISVVDAESRKMGEWNQLFLEKFAKDIITRCAVIATRCEAQGTKNIGAEILEYYQIED